MMQFYMAPMEGLTSYIYRSAYHKYFHDVDKYFTPFITNKIMSYKEINDILPEHNEGMQVVPQILTNRAQDFLALAGALKEYGYTCVNLNLGCPSGTVVSKNRGAGFLALPEELDHFLEEIFAACPLKISIKTRIGKEHVEEWDRLRSIYEKYPLEELIIHPRLRVDYYKNKPNMDAFLAAAASSRHSLCYNGDICSAEDFWNVSKQFQTVEKMMLGRGLIAHPGLPGAIKSGTKLQKDTLLDFHNDILSGYCAIMSGDRNTLFKMKELWHYLGENFTNSSKYIKKIKKAERLIEYEAAVRSLFAEQELVMSTD